MHPGADLGIPPFSSATLNHHAEDTVSSKSMLAADLDLAGQGESYGYSADLSHRQLLQILGVPPLRSSDLPAVQAALDAAINDRERKVKEGLQDLNSATDSELVAHLNNAACTNSLLLGGLLEDTKFHNVELFDPRLKSQVSKLKLEIDEIRSDMADLDTEEIHLASSKREDFVNKWLS